MSGVGVDHMRHHMISLESWRGHVIRHVTYLGVSEDYTSRRDLESSKIQHVISKTFREEEANSNKVDYRKEVLSGRKLHAFKKVQQPVLHE